MSMPRGGAHMPRVCSAMRSGPAGGGSSDAPGGCSAPLCVPELCCTLPGVRRETGLPDPRPVGVRRGLRHVFGVQGVVSWRAHGAEG